MATLEITGPDGKTIELVAPEGATPDQINAKVAEIKSNWANVSGPKTSALGAFATGLGQAAFGLGDEIEAGIRAAVDPNKTYDETLPEVRQRVRDSASEHPIAYYGGEIGGAVAVPGGLARLGVRSAVQQAAGQGLPALARAGLTEGAAYGAAYGAGKSEGGVQQRLEGAAGGAAMGGALGAAVPVVIAGGRAVTEPIINEINAFARPQWEAGRRIRTAMDLDDEAHRAADAVLGPGNVARNAEAQRLIQAGQAGDELRNIDAGGENIRGLARSAANNSPQAREILQRMTNDRFEGQAGRTVDFVRGVIGGRGNAVESREALRTAARQARAPLYRQAYEAGDRPIWSDTLERLSGAPMVRQAMERAAQRGKDRAIADGYGAFNTRVQFDPSGRIQFTRGPEGVPTYPNLQYFDYVKRELDDIANSARRAGENETASVAGQFARQLRDELDTVVPQYQAARGEAARFFGADDALEAGEIFAQGGNRYSANEAARAVQNMRPAERSAFQEGYFSALIEKIERSGDRRNIVGRLANSPDERRRMEIAFGPNRAREIEAFLHIEQLMDMPRTALGNSTTARQLVELGLAGGTGLLASGGSITDPRAWLVGGLTYGLTRGRQAVDQNMARNIAEMLVSRDPAVFQRGLQQAAHGPALNALRRISGALAQGQGATVGAITGGVAAQTP